MQRRRLEADGKFPQRFKLNPDGGPFGAIGWDYDELMAWVAERRDSRKPTAEPEPLADAKQSAAA